MTEPTQDNEEINSLPLAGPARRSRRRLPLIWIVPVVVVLVGAGLVVKNVLETGPTIKIHFSNAEGLEANKTKIKYENVEIGTVKTVSLGPDKHSVVVTAAMAHEASDLLVDDTRFWVVRPRVAGGQISGLTTLLSGSYIGMDIGKSDHSQRDFKGLDLPPTVTSDEPGAEFVLHGSDLGSLDIGSPVYYRRVAVGQVTAATLDTNGAGVSLKIFVHSPYEHLVTEHARFWHASGIDVSVDSSGIKLRTQSIVSVLLGGIAFRPPIEGEAGGAAPSESNFTLYENETLAMKRTDAEASILVARFTQSVRGLAVGSQVDFRGITLGEVKSIDVEFDPEHHTFSFPVELTIYADRLRSRKPGSVGPGDMGAGELDRAIAHGLRAQIRSANILTGQHYVALDFFPDVKPAKIDLKQIPREIPTLEGSSDDLQLTLTDIARKIDKIPFEQLAGDLRQTLQSMDGSLKEAQQLMQHVDKDIAPQLQQTLIEAKQTMHSANELLSSDAPLQQDLRSTLRELTQSAASLRALTDYLERHPESLLRGKPADVQEK